jgi:ATP-binding cassette, subfamily B, multidrug efflux pump
VATKYVNADRLLRKQPKGIHEEVRERGNNFSAGERQLISFARTLIHQPRIIILDEATANIDTETEIIIQESLKKMLSIGTSFIVAHRLSTIQHVDQIIVMAHGKIIEKGTHVELLKEKGHYYQLYQIQFKDALLA